MKRRYLWAGFVILIGISALLDAMDLGTFWEYLWPIAIILAGLAMMFPEKE
jgi:hypothetical protein